MRSTCCDVDASMAKRSKFDSKIDQVGSFIDLDSFFYNLTLKWAPSSCKCSYNSTCGGHKPVTHF